MFEDNLADRFAVYGGCSNAICNYMHNAFDVTVRYVSVQVELHEAKMRKHPISDQEERTRRRPRRSGKAVAGHWEHGQKDQRRPVRSGRCIAGKEKRGENKTKKGKKMKRESVARDVEEEWRSKCRGRKRSRGAHIGSMNRKINNLVINRQRCPAL